MKKFTLDDFGHRGALPPALDAYIDTDNRAAETAKFVKVIESVCWQSYEDPRQVRLPNIFGQDTQITYAASGSNARVYKLQIGAAVFALKINKEPRVIARDLESMHLVSKARHLINKAYLGATSYMGRRQQYSWLLSQWQDRNQDKQYDAVREKLVYVGLIKGIYYYDLGLFNVMSGKIIDLDGLKQKEIDLKRSEIDIVKKLVFDMRRDDMDAFADRMSELTQTHPRVVRYVYNVLNDMQRELTGRLSLYWDIASSYNRITFPVYEMEKSQGR